MVVQWVSLALIDVGWWELLQHFFRSIQRLNKEVPFVSKFLTLDICFGTEEQKFIRNHWIVDNVDIAWRKVLNVEGHT